MAQGYHSALKFLGTSLPFVFAILILVFKEYFLWLGDGVVYEISGFLFAIGILHILFTALAKTLKNHLFLSTVRYLYAIFLLFLIYRTGISNSSFIFVLLLPVIVPAARLDMIATRNTGFVMTAGFALLLFSVQTEDWTIDFLVKHGIQAILLGAVSYLIYRTVTETIQRNDEREEAARKMTQMVQVDKLKSDFLSIAQHQLRTPLSGVKWALEMLKTDESIPLESQSLIDQSLARIKDSLSIINQMLKTVEEEDTPALQIESVDLVGMIRGIIAELNFLVVKKSVKVTYICPDSLIIPADKDKLKAALLNLVDNAIKYSPKGKVNVTITEDPEKAILTIIDTGIGIPADDLPYIFERLHRSKNAVLIEPDESGVGLSISYKIISLHGGTIKVDSEVGRGTTIVVNLPKG